MTPCSNHECEAQGCAGEEANEGTEQVAEHSQQNTSRQGPANPADNELELLKVKDEEERLRHHVVDALQQRADLVLVFELFSEGRDGGQGAGMIAASDT